MRSSTIRQRPPGNQGGWALCHVASLVQPLPRCRRPGAAAAPVAPLTRRIAACLLLLLQGVRRRSRRAWRPPRRWPLRPPVGGRPQAPGPGPQWLRLEKGAGRGLLLLAYPRRLHVALGSQGGGQRQLPQRTQLVLVGPAAAPTETRPDPPSSVLLSCIGASSSCLPACQLPVTAPTAQPGSAARSASLVSRQKAVRAEQCNPIDSTSTADGCRKSEQRTAAGQTAQGGASVLGSLARAADRLVATDRRATFLCLTAGPRLLLQSACLRALHLYAKGVCH